MTAPEPHWLQLTGDALATLTTIGANLTVIIGGIYAGREALKKLSALVRINAAQVTSAEEARAPQEAADVTAWREERARVIFTAAIEEAERLGYSAGISREQFKAMTGEELSRVRSFLEGHVAALALVMRETTDQNRKHWIDVVYAEFAKYDVPVLNAMIKRHHSLAAALSDPSAK